jgi:hypothetical protein
VTSGLAFGVLVAVVSGGGMAEAAETVHHDLTSALLTGGVVVAALVLVRSVIRGLAPRDDGARRRRQADLFRLSDREERFAEAASIRRRRHGASFRQSPDRHERPNETEPASVLEARRTLGVGRDASERDVILAHREKMRRAHPDHGGSTEAAARLNDARWTLMKHINRHSAR